MEGSKSLNVFLVEDNELYSLMLDHKLQDVANYRFITFSSAEEAIDNLYLHPDIMILDYRLPGMNGLEALKKIKIIRQSLPVIILTSQDDPQVASEIMKAGAEEYISKSRLDINELCERVTEICEKYHIV